jgi:hypothetical protein
MKTGELAFPRHEPTIPRYWGGYGVDSVFPGAQFNG